MKANAKIARTRSVHSTQTRASVYTPENPELDIPHEKDHSPIANNTRGHRTIPTHARTDQHAKYGEVDDHLGRVCRRVWRRGGRSQG